MTTEIGHAITHVHAVGASEALIGVGVPLDALDISKLAPALAVLIEGRRIEDVIGDTLAAGIVAGVNASRPPPG